MTASGWKLEDFHKHEWTITHHYSQFGFEQCICGAVISNRYGSEIVINKGSVRILLMAVEK